MTAGRDAVFAQRVRHRWDRDAQRCRPGRRRYYLVVALDQLVIKSPPRSECFHALKSDHERATPLEADESAPVDARTSSAWRGIVLRRTAGLERGAECGWVMAC